MSEVHVGRRLVLARFAVATLTAFAMTPSLADLPPPAEWDNPRARLQGAGALRFFGLRIYEARLWTAPGADAEDYRRCEFALELVYDRRLPGQAIAERSIAEMHRIGPFDEAQANAWLELMKRAFPDVVASDRLVGVHDGQGGVRFFYNGKQTAQTVDAEYARLFFGIWLDRKTSAPALREALLGRLDPTRRD